MSEEKGDTSLCLGTTPAVGRAWVITSVVYWLGLTLWVAAIVSAAVAAGFVFGKLPSMGVTLDRFEHYDQAQHGRLAAGMVMEPVFAFVDLAQAAAGLVVVMAMAIQFTVLRSPLKRFANWMRACAS